MDLSWKERAGKSSGLPNLGLGGTIVAFLIGSYLAAIWGDDLMVILVRGSQAFYVEGVRISDWKHGVMSDGQGLSAAQNSLRLILEFAFAVSGIAVAECAAGFVRVIQPKVPRVGFAIIRLVGGGMLWAFAIHLWNTRFPIIHPIPLGSAIAGTVQIIRGVRAFAGQKPPNDHDLREGAAK